MAEKMYGSRYMIVANCTMPLYDAAETKNTTTNSWITMVDRIWAFLVVANRLGNNPSRAIITIGSAHSICHDTYAPSTDKHRPIETSAPPHGPTTASSTAPIELSGSAANSSWLSTP